MEETPEVLKDRVLVCKDCHRKFVFIVKEQKYFGQKGWSAPVRCKYCRRQKSILDLVLKDGVSIGDEIRFSEICDKCSRTFFTNIKRKEGVNLYCDDCWVEIKYVNPKGGKKDTGVVGGKTEVNQGVS